MFWIYSGLTTSLWRGVGGPILQWKVASFGEITAPISINNAGTIIGLLTLRSGSGFDTHFISQGWIQTATGTPRTFPLPQAITTFPFRFPPVAARINNHGAAVIEDRYVTLDAEGNAVVTPINLGPCVNITATAINDNGLVTGYCNVVGQ